MVNPVAASMVTKIIETKYTKGISMLGYGKRTPLWSLMPKKPDFYETTLTLRNQYGLNPSGSALFATARSRQGASAYGAFALTQASAYGSVAFDGKTAKSIVAGDTKRAIGIVTREVDSQVRAFGQRMNRMAYTNHGGSLGIRITSGGATQTITVYPEHRPLLKNVWAGQYLVTSNTDGTSGSVDANPKIVSAVDREAGTITTSAAVSWANGTGGYSDDDYLFLDGDFGATLYGVDSWVPSSAPSGSFLGQDRGLDPVYLGGVRYVAASGAPDGTIIGSLVNASVEAFTWGAEPDVTLMNTLDYGKLLREVEGRIEFKQVVVPARRGGYDEQDMMIDVGITGVRVSVMGNASMTVVPDNDCPRNTALMLDMRTWCFHGIGMTEPEWLDHTGQGRWHNMATDNIDGMEANIGIYGNIGCDSPGCNARVDLTDVL
jgi:hypothetical protein